MKIHYSPLTGKPMRVVYEPDVWPFRGEDYHYIHIAFRDDERGEQFTTTESDTICYNQATNQYREKYGIPYQDEIIGLRTRYGLSATKMALILGFGTNQYRLYEEGEVPSESNGKMIRSAMNPKVFLDLVKASRNQMTDKEFAKISAKIEEVITQSEGLRDEQREAERLFRSKRGLADGFAPQSTARLRNLLLYIINNCDYPFYTKLNKILFYIDFTSYRERGQAISGLAYQALSFGPAPERWDRIYSAFDDITPVICKINGREGTMLRTNSVADESVFIEEEREIIHIVCSVLGPKSSRELTELSHNEDAWKNCFQTSDSDIANEATLMAFKDSFSIRAI